MDQTEQTRKSTKINPHPIIFPKLIRIWNNSPEEYYNYICSLGGDNEYAHELIQYIHNWIEKTNYPVYLNA